MVLKRPFSEEGHYDYEVLNHKAKQRVASSNFPRNVMDGLSSQELASTLEPLIRGWVRDEVQRACQSFCCSSPRSPFNALEPCSPTSLQLRFQTKLPQMLFTGSKVESENNDAVKLVLYDTDSNQIVSSGPLSSSKVHIVPLDGDFSVDDDDEWSQKEFEAKIIYAREGKRPLVAGDQVVVLKDGVGDLGEVCFTDNSSWRRSRTFRLGARVVSGVRVREAVSEPFMVKDQRGESYKKHHPPALGDDIWRLEKIAKDGVFHKRLSSNKIHTVKHFMQMYITNEPSLRKILGVSCNKTWETIIKHAKECVLDDKLYMYNCGSEGIGLLFDSVFKIVRATFDGQNYLSLEELPAFQMPLVESLKNQIYKNLEGVLPVDDLSVFGSPIITSGLLGGSVGSGADLVLQNVNIPPLHLGM
ncbi:calmodulin-binding protein 60 B-like [Bidens hawaiensis]|uniref:calmodulin-binding protein 60 B-like n=1 Tax=Bidens hawaiensis TaxID=980011 RepID=UPI00404B0774